MQDTIALAPVRTGAPALRSVRSRAGRHATPQKWITNHRQLLGTAAVLALILAAFMVAAVSLLVEPAAPSPSGWTQVAVEPNASLWSLASAHPVAGLTTAETATLIAEENGLESGVIHPGQTVRVPSSGHADTAVALR